MERTYYMRDYSLVGYELGELVVTKVISVKEGYLFDMFVGKQAIGYGEWYLVQDVKLAEVKRGGDWSSYGLRCLPKWEEFRCQLPERSLMEMSDRYAVIRRSTDLRECGYVVTFTTSRKRIVAALGAGMTRQAGSGHHRYGEVYRLCKGYIKPSESKLRDREHAERGSIYSPSVTELLARDIMAHGVRVTLDDMR